MLGFPGIPPKHTNARNYESFEGCFGDSPANFLYKNGGFHVAHAIGVAGTMAHLNSQGANGCDLVCSEGEQAKAENIQSLQRPSKQLKLPLDIADCQPCFLCQKIVALPCFAEAFAKRWHGLYTCRCRYTTTVDAGRWWNTA